MAQSDREVLFSNETLVIGMFQAVSAGATVAAIAQADTLIDLAGYDAFRGFLTVMSVALLAALCAAYFKHQYKLWDQKALVSGDQDRSDEAQQRARKSARYLRIMRTLLAASLISIALGLIGLTVALWASEPPAQDDDSDCQPGKVMRI